MRLQFSLTVQSAHAILIYCFPCARIASLHCPGLVHHSYEITQPYRELIHSVQSNSLSTLMAAAAPIKRIRIDTAGREFWAKHFSTQVPKLRRHC